MESLPTVARASILIQTTGVDITGLVVAGNVINGSDGVLLNVTATSPQTVSGVFSGNALKSSGANAQGISVSRVVNSVISNNKMSCGFIGLYLNDCTNVRGSSNNCRESGTYTVASGGVNSNTFFDSSNDFDMTNPAGILAGDGVALEQRSDSAPAGGYWFRGSRVEQSLPAVGSPKGWVCTVSGSPGTWVSEGSL